MALDRGEWLRAVTRVQWVAKVAQLLWWVAMLVPPTVALVAFPDLLLQSLLAAAASLVLMHRLVFHLGAGRTVRAVQARIRAGGPDLTQRQVAQLLRDGIAQGDSCSWVTIQDEAHVRVVGEGRESAAPARSSSPWVWAMGGGGS